MLYDFSINDSIFLLAFILFFDLFFAVFFALFFAFVLILSFTHHTTYRIGLILKYHEGKASYSYYFILDGYVSYDTPPPSYL